MFRRWAAASGLILAGYFAMGALVRARGEVHPSRQRDRRGELLAGCFDHRAHTHDVTKRHASNLGHPRSLSGHICCKARRGQFRGVRPSAT